MPDPNQYIPDLTERFPSDREEQEETYDDTDDRVDEYLMERK